MYYQIFAMITKLNTQILYYQIFAMITKLNTQIFNDFSFPKIHYAMSPFISINTRM